MQIIVKESHSIDYKQHLYLPGDKIDLPKKEAKRLIAKGVAEMGLKQKDVETGLKQKDVETGLKPVSAEVE